MRRPGNYFSSLLYERLYKNAEVYQRPHKNERLPSSKFTSAPLGTS